MSTLFEEMVSISFSVLMIIFLLMADIKSLFGVSVITVLGSSYFWRHGLKKREELMVSYRLSHLNSFMHLDFLGTQLKISERNLNFLKNKTLNLILKRKSNKNFHLTNLTLIFLLKLVLTVKSKNLVWLEIVLATKSLPLSHQKVSFQENQMIEQFIKYVQQFLQNGLAAFQ